MEKNKAVGISLSDVKLTIGVVLSHTDPDNRGRVKAYVPGVFSPSTMDIDAMPWIYPLTMSNYNSFSLQNSNSKIWVIILPDNPFGYFYIPYFELSEATKSIISGDTDILLSRSTGSGHATIYYNNEDGIVAKKGSSKIDINKSGDVAMLSNSTNVKIEGGHITIGKEGDGGEPMIMGDKLKTLLNNLSSGLQQTASKALSSPYTMPVGSELQKVVQQLNEDITTISSSTCSLTE